MKTILFIHGTGVRESAYNISFGLVQQALTCRLGATGVRLEHCFWGGICGAKLFLDGISIPTFDTTKALPGLGRISGGRDEDEGEEYQRSLWALLYDDPFAELDLLALRAASDTAAEENRPPNWEPPGDELDRKAKQLTVAPDRLSDEAKTELLRLLTETDLAGYLENARNDVVGHPSYTAALQTAVEPLTDYRLAIARSLVARSLQLWQSAQDVPDGFMPMDGVVRDRIVELVVAALGGREAGVWDWVKEKAGGLVKRVATRRITRKRGHFSNEFAPFVADIVMYQARPTGIRDFIRDTIRAASNAAKTRGENGEVSLIAHSLGGIATVDTLIEQPLPMVRHLITVGSQAPLFYELNALSSLPFDKEIPRGKPHPLPDHFSKSWLNIYDKHDFLSYIGEDVFGKERVTDFEVDNRQPFPESHSAYWTNTKVWDAIVSRVGV